MKSARLLTFCLSCSLAVVLACAQHDAANALVNDSNITIRKPADVTAKRSALIRYIWGAAGFPANRLPSGVRENDRSPVVNLANLERVDSMQIAMDNGILGMSHHFIPKKKNQRLVILHLGHTDRCTFNDGVGGEPDIGMRRTINRLLREGFSVLAVYMPHTTIEDCTGGHREMLGLRTSGSPLKFFFEPTAVSLNYLQANFPHYRDISMIGLSGGGWTTTVYAALDPRIRRSIQVAGSIPLYLAYDGYNHDLEQYLDSFYRLAGYLDLYLLGSFGSGRQQIQILNRYDDVAFGERQHNAALAGKPFMKAVREYESRIKAALRSLGKGSFSVHIDETAKSHQISDHALTQVIMPALRKP